MREIRILRRVLAGIVLLVLAFLPLVSTFWSVIQPILSAFESQLKLVGYIIGPIFAVVGFIWTRIDKHELKRTSEALGRQEAEAKQAHREAQEARRTVEAGKATLAAREERIDALEGDLRRMTQETDQLWQLRPRRPFPEYSNWLRNPKGAKVVTVGIFKGGVGKTTLAANFAAYISEKREKPVLLVDLDYQGSLSSLVLLAAGSEIVGSYVDHLFEPDADLATLCRYRLHLTPELKRGWIVPADYDLNKRESRLLLELLMTREEERDGKIDPRYRLAHALLNPTVREQFAAIIIDTPPRMTIGTVNAFVASHYYLVPTILDRVSSEAVEPFIRNIEGMKKELDLDVRCLGLVANMTRQEQLSSKEQGRREDLSARVATLLELDRDPFFSRTIPLRTAIQSHHSNRLAYFLSDSQNNPLRKYYDELFDDVWRRITSYDEPPTPEADVES
jgi:cellulose biosynthesis protein BcsQ